MLSREFMGVALLGVIWVAALLMAASAWQDVRDLLRRRRSFRLLGPSEAGEGMVRGKIAVAKGDGDALAVLRVEQIGRAQDTDARSIAFSDRKHTSLVAGGTVEAERGEVLIEPADAESSELWTTEAERARALACPSLEAFDPAYADAKKARGHVREIAMRAGAGDEVFVAGLVEKRGDAWVVRAPDGAPLVVSTFDPRAFCSTHVARMLVFVALELALCALATRLALWRPVFGPVSTGGAVLGLVFFFFATPIAVAIRQRARVPSRASMRATWVEPRTNAAPAKAAA